MMIVSIDLGYGFVKAVSEDRNVIFPSVLAPATNQMFSFDETIQTKHLVSVRTPDKDASMEYYVGDAAIKESRGAQLSFNQTRYNSSTALILSATAAYLAGATGNVTLGCGIPLAFYKDHKEAVEKSFKNKELLLRVDNGPEHTVRFNDVHVYPQGVGVLFNDNQIKANTLVGVIDIGYFTTDYLMTEITNQGFIPMKNYMSSAEIGVNTAQKNLASIIQSITGKNMTLIDVQNYCWNKDSMTFAGQKINVVEHREKTIRDVGQALTDTIRAAWSEKIDYVDDIILAGGGALEFLEVIKENIKGARITNNPQFANANGFYKMTEKKLEKLRVV